MAIQDDITVAANGNIRYVGAAHGAAGAGYYSVIQLHRFLGDLSDNPSAVSTATSGDYLDITDSTPSERSTDNIITLLAPYNIDDTLAEHLFDGTIIQDGGNTIYDGLVVIAGRGMDLQIVQNGAVIANDFWNTIPNGSTFKGLNSDPSNGISHRFMMKVRTAGADIDGRRLLGQTREWGYTFSEFRINGTARGNNVMALTYAVDLNNQTAIGSMTAAPFTTISNLVAGYNGIDVDANSVLEYYYSKWDKGTTSINQFYEYIKYLQRSGSAATLYGLSGEVFRGITHQFAYDTEVSGPFVQGQALTWGSGATAGSGQLLALQDNGTTGTMWIQLLTGAAPVDNMTINQTGGKSCLVNGTVTERTLSFPACGVSTGSAIIGAYGFGIEASDLAATDKVFDLTNTQVTPPNNQTFTVNGLVAGEDYVLVGPESGGTLNAAQFQLQTTLSTDNITSVVINAAIPSDTPLTGHIRVQDNAGVFRKLHYSARSGSTFTIDTVDGNEDFAGVNATTGNNVFIAYIDKLADSTFANYSAVFSSTRALFVRVRDGGGSPIKTFESAASFGSGGGSVSVIRTSDA
jgi:hypothetical protein